MIDTFFTSGSFSQVSFYFFHFPGHIVYSISVRIEHVGTEVRLVQRREEVLRHHSHYYQRDDKEYDHRPQRHDFPPNQNAQYFFELVIERFVIRIFAGILCLWI